MNKTDKWSGNLQFPKAIMALNLSLELLPIAPWRLLIYDTVSSHDKKKSNLLKKDFSISQNGL